MAGLLCTVLAMALVGLGQSATLVSLDLGTEFMKVCELVILSELVGVLLVLIACSDRHRQTSDGAALI